MGGCTDVGKEFCVVFVMVAGCFAIVRVVLVRAVKYVIEHWNARMNGQSGRDEQKVSECPN